MNNSLNICGTGKINESEFERFHQDGVIIIRNYFNFEQDILPIQKDVYWLIGQIIEEYQLPISQQPFSPETFDSALPEMLSNYRNLVVILYDAIKKFPSFFRWSFHHNLQKDTSFLFQSEKIGIAHRGFGIRMDNPNEDKFLTQLHQDYTSQLCSPDGIVIWSPLSDVDKLRGPVRIWPGSHKHGIRKIIKKEASSYGLILADENTLEKDENFIEAELKVTDAVFMNFLTLHKSNPNHSLNTRWAMITRMFDFNNKVGRSHGWKGGIQENNFFDTVHPDLVILEK